jgi:dipeptidase D
MIPADLEPRAVWRHFATLLAIPHPSKHEEELRDALKEWADERALVTLIDAAGNLIIRKPASAGRENEPGVILQGHLDMVCQQNKGSTHDFMKDAITTVIEGDWLIAPETTLGADNGIGAALALAVLEDEELSHPALEVLLTVDEEAGMGGALGLEEGLLQGRRLINLDTEDWGEIYLGCAGGIDVTVSRSCARETLPEGHALFELEISGLVGGHSGVDIDSGRGNAIALLVRLLVALGQDLRLVSLAGGTARNALPREALAQIALPRELAPRFARRITEFQALLIDELAGVDDGVTIRFEAVAASASDALAREDQRALLAALNVAPNGVKRMSVRVPGVVETSDNLGVVGLAGDQFSARFLVRSLLSSGIDSLVAEIEGLFSLIGASVQAEGGYPGWAPNPDSPLLALMQKVYRREFGTGDAAVKVIHAGLECGVIKSKYPALDIVSFGPDIRGAHAPGERVGISSVAKAWRFLTAVLAENPAD